MYPNPNPNTDTNSVKFEFGEVRGTISIYSTTGHIVRKIETTNSMISIDLTGLSAGMCIYNFENKRQITIGKIILRAQQRMPSN
jgi:hypothetical protein